MPALLVAACLIAAAIWWTRRNLVVVTVSGASMAPTLRHGDSVLVRRVPISAVSRGALVVVELPPQGLKWASLGGPTRFTAGRSWVVKRAVALPGDVLLPEHGGGAEGRVPQGALFVMGDNIAMSYDSRRTGPAPGERLLGVVMVRLRRGKNSKDLD
jgi:signal peptidase I